MAAFNVDSVRESENKVYPGSPQLARKAINEIDTSEQTGVPLNTPWTFWLDKTVRGTSAAQYEASLKKLYTVNTVQGFWSVYNNIPDPSELSSRYSYHLMRFCDATSLEDEYNSKGGHWRLKCHKHDTPTVWKELLLAAIGEQLSEFMAEDDEIGGVSVSIRDRDDIIQIWNTKSQHAEAATVITKVRQLLPKVTFTTIFYKGDRNCGIDQGQINLVSSRNVKTVTSETSFSFMTATDLQHKHFNVNNTRTSVSTIPIMTTPSLTTRPRHNLFQSSAFQSHEAFESEKAFKVKR